MKIINDAVFKAGFIIGFILGVLGIDLKKGGNNTNGIS